MSVLATSTSVSAAREEAAKNAGNGENDENGEKGEYLGTNFTRVPCI